MRIICTQNEDYKLTVGKVYEAEDSSRDFYKLLNDNNIGVRYHKRLFDVVPEEEAVPEVQAPPARTEQDMISSITFERGNVNYTDLENNVIVISNCFTRFDSNISCGVKSYNGINNQIQRINEKFDFDQDDFIEIRKALFKACIENYTRHPTSDAFRLFSTNVSGEDNGFLADEDMLSVLDEMANAVSESRENPNSGRSIKVWVL